MSQTDGDLKCIHYFRNVCFKTDMWIICTHYLVDKQWRKSRKNKSFMHRSNIEYRNRYRQPQRFHVASVLKYGNFRLLEPSVPVEACNGIALTFYTRLVKSSTIQVTTLFLNVQNLEKNYSCLHTCPQHSISFPLMAIKARSGNQPFNHYPTNQKTIQPADQTTDWPADLPIDLSIGRSIDSINQSKNEYIIQSTYSLCVLFLVLVCIVVSCLVCIVVDVLCALL